jgi:hypothetical protein
MRLLLLAVALVLASTAARAQTCQMYGSFMSCSDGTTGYRYGNTQLFGSGNERGRSPTPMYGSWGSTYSGNSTIFSDGRSAYTSGDTTVTIDARTCYRYGDTLICNRVPKGLTPSATRRALR